VLVLLSVMSSLGERTSESCGPHAVQ